MQTQYKKVVGILYNGEDIRVFKGEEKVKTPTKLQSVSYYLSLYTVDSIDKERIADMKNNIIGLNKWLYRRIRMCIWKQWKLPKTRRRKLKGLGLPEWAACEGAYSRKSYWRMSNAGVVKRALTKERLINWGFYDIATAYQSLHINY